MGSLNISLIDNTEMYDGLFLSESVDFEAPLWWKQVI